MNQCMCIAILQRLQYFFGKVTFVAVTILCCGRGGVCQELKTSLVTPAFFSETISPLLEKHCIGCHGPEEQEGGLRLDSVTGISTGGKSGSAVVPGAVDESLLMSALQYMDEALQMPPEEKLSSEAIEAFSQWIQAGAPHPEGRVVVHSPAPVFDPVESRKFWSLTPPVRPHIPHVLHPEFVVSPIDGFIESQLEAKGLLPAAVADKTTLIRRATFGLTGLPPTPDEIDRFLADDSPNAFENVIDRLLSSPHYGEHWARHWLDVVRYADSNGLDENIAHGNAWRYRDYVIESLNADKPFDQFVKEHLAGDLLVGPDTSQSKKIEFLTATGFLTMGPKVLAEGDQTKMLMDIIDEQIDTTGRAFLGLSLGCARCHDHKFDPISQADYYSIAGIFQSTETMESLVRIAKWHENSIASPEEQESHRQYLLTIDTKKTEIENLIKHSQEEITHASSALPNSTESRGDEKGSTVISEEKFPENVRTQLSQLREEQKALEGAVPQMASAMGVQEKSSQESRIHIRGSHLSLGRRVSRGIPAVLEIDSPLSIAAGSGRKELAEWMVHPRHPLTSRVLVNRLWRWHFGRGIVATTENFGILGEKPSNQPLLDWLAVELIESGYSLKKMHRAIMLSRTYQLSSDPQTCATKEQAAQVDPGNILRWRSDVRRLPAESIRDAMLVVSGTLDRSMGGTLLHVANRAFLFDHTSKDETRYDSLRRSIYLPVIRNHIHDAFWLFDSTDGAVPNGDRGTSTVASQALYMLNSDFVMQVSKAIAESLFVDSPVNLDTDARTTIAFRRILGRTPAESELVLIKKSAEKIEMQLQMDGIPQAERALSLWTVLSQTLVTGNEFLFIR